MTARLTASGLVAIAIATAGGAPTASAALQPCEGGERGCGTVEVPLDRSGAVPGTVRLHVEVDRPPQTPTEATAPPLLAIGGPPGEAGTERFDTSSLNLAGRTVVTLDLRGTGASGPLRCDRLQRTGLHRAASAAAACAATLGPRRAFYTAHDSAQDIEAVRQQLGAERIVLLGVSYGARVVTAYARLHPDRVDRLVLVSPVRPDGIDPLYRSSFAAVPRVVRQRCATGVCRRGSPSPVADLVALARRLERRPLSGRVVDGPGRSHELTLGGFDLFQLIRAGDESVLPGYVRGALRGDPAALLRELDRMAWYRRSLAAPEVAKQFSLATYAAATCEESSFPWPRAAPLADRGRYLSAVASSATARAFGPFGARAAVQSDLVELCRRWPATATAPEPTGLTGRVPTLVLGYVDDLEAPVADARAVAESIPGARLVELADGGDCAIERFLVDRDPAPCRRSRYGISTVRASAPPPRSLAQVAAGARASRARRTLVAVKLTLQDGASALQARFFSTYVGLLDGDRRLPLRKSVQVGGLRGGGYWLGLRHGRFGIVRAAYVPGVLVTGAIAPGRNGDPTLRGRLRVSGRAAARGRLTLRGPILSGRLDGREVRLRVVSGAYPDVTFGR